MRNAIPREALAEILVPQNQKENLLQWWNHYSKQVTNVWKEKEPDFRLELVEFSTADLPLNQNSLDKIIKSILECPNGVIQWIKENPNIVETSTNIGVIHLSSNKCAIKTLQRSSIEKEKLKLHNRVKTIFEKYGAIVTSDGSYPGWEPNTNSKLLQLSQKLYKEMYKKDPVVTVMHAGLETGVISGIIPGLDMLSIGPTIQFPHSPDERVEVHSVKLFWNFLLKLLEIF